MIERVYVIQMWNAEKHRWEPCADAYLEREAAGFGLKGWRSKCPDDKFRAHKYLPFDFE